LFLSPGKSHNTDKMPSEAGHRREFSPPLFARLRYRDISVMHRPRIQLEQLANFGQFTSSEYTLPPFLPLDAIITDRPDGARLDVPRHSLGRNTWEGNDTSERRLTRINRGRHLSYKRSRHTTKPAISLIQIEGVDNTEAAKYVTMEERYEDRKEPD
jgi:hypothetical protein